MTPSKSFTVMPWPRARGGPQVLLSRFIRTARQQGYWVWPSWFIPRRQPALFLGNYQPEKGGEAPRRRVYRIAGMYIEDHFRRFGDLFGDRCWRPDFVAANEKTRQALMQADFVIYQSGWSKRQLDTLYQRPEGSWEIIPNAVPIDLFTPLPDALHRAVQPPVIGTVGAARGRPRLEVFFDVARRLPVRPRLLLVGSLDGYCKATLAKAMADPYWHHAIQYVPSVPPHRLVGYYQQMDCLLHTVIGDTCPNVVVEALACGVPVVCPLEGGTAELVGSGGLAIADPEMLYGEPLRAGMANAIETVLANLPHYRQMARQQAENNHSMAKMTDRYLQALGFPAPVKAAVAAQANPRRPLEG
ncbi:MAG: glycosyltransferase family 4 protein [Magnetococcales bacterium]|nr:glycosyltransferase family 4 protein [Magnetococcales bacterium]